MGLYSQPGRLDQIAKDVADLKRDQKALANSPQAQRTSVEGGSMDFNDSDGNLKTVIGDLDDGTTTIWHVDGPTPPAPTAPLVAVDGPILTPNWDGMYVDGAEAPRDLSHIDVIATHSSGDRVTSTLTIGDRRAAVMAATREGQWDVWLEAVSLAKKRSAPSESVTIDVTMAELEGPIRDAQQSANGKNQVHYDDRPPTPSDPGIAGDVWWVGTMGRPTDVVEATNLNPNPSFEASSPLTGYVPDSSVTLATFSTAGYYKYGTRGARATVAAGADTATYVGTPLVSVTGGQWVATGLDVYSRQGSKFSDFRIFFYDASNAYISGPHVGGKTDVSGGFTRIYGGVQAPANAVSARAYFYIYNDAAGAAPVANTQVSFDGWSIAQSPTQAGAIANVQTYFDGDTPSGATENESHYRWTGDPHASTSEKYLPDLPNSDADVWNILAQYMHDGTGWQEVQLQHHVFASVDLGKATVGYLSGIRIESRTISAEQLNGDVFTGQVFRGSTFVTTDGTGTWSDAGLFINSPDGTSLVRFPTDGSPLSLTASDVQIERADIGEAVIANGSIPSSGSLLLSSGVTPPSIAPTLNSAWLELTPLPRPDEPNMDWNGLAAWGDKWVRAVNVLGTGDGDRFEVYNSDGSVNKTVPIEVDPRHGVAVIGDVAYTVGKDHDRPDSEVYGFGYNLTTGARVARWTFPGVPAGMAGLAATSSGELLTVYVNESGGLSARARNPSTGAAIAGKIWDGSWGISYTKDIKGTHLDGSTLYVVHRNGARGYAASGTTLTLLDGANAVGWSNPNANAGGFVMNSTGPVVVDSGVLFQGNTTVSASVRQACYTWFNGTHETTPSEVTQIDVPGRQTVTASVQNRAGLQKRLYVRGGTSGNWARYTIADGVTSFVVPAGIASYALPTTNTFPNADPAILKSTNNAFEVRGDGSGHWGPLVFNSDGSMTSNNIPEWVPITTFLNGWGPHTDGYAPAYRVWPDGKVEVRGAFAKSGGVTAGSVAFTVPSAAVPARHVGCAVTTSSGSGSSGVARFEIRPPSQDAAVFPISGSNVPWFMVESFYYYLT